MPSGGLDGNGRRRSSTSSSRLGEGTDSSFASPISRLPFELVHAIVRLASTPDTKPQHGGTVRSWHSYEAAAPFALVCKSWRQPAQAVLYSSVALVGARRARRFADALASSETAAQLARTTTAYLVLGLDRDVEHSHDASRGQLEISELLTEAVQACPAAVHLHIRPLHQDVRARLLPAVVDPKRALVTCILSPRIMAAVHWSGELWRLEDAARLAPTLQNLEQTALMAPLTPPDEGNISPPPPTFGALSLRRVKVHYGYPATVLVAAFSQSPDIELLDLYFESAKPVDKMREAFAASAKSLRHVRYICNPASPDSDNDTDSINSASEDGERAPLFDLVLPSLTRLETLRVSATEISHAALLHLPLTLRRLTIKSYNVGSRFTRPGLVEFLQRDDLAFPDSFTDLVVVDTPEQWHSAAVAEITDECAKRGVRFVFRNDFEQEGEDESGTEFSSRKSFEEGGMAMPASSQSV
ncbi:hypothetical protein JCM10049v2_002657 [Rhodotorula toruloides]